LDHACRKLSCAMVLDGKALSELSLTLLSSVDEKLDAHQAKIISILDDRLPKKRRGHRLERAVLGDPTAHSLSWMLSDAAQILGKKGAYAQDDAGRQAREDGEASLQIMPHSLAAEERHCSPVPQPSLHIVLPPKDSGPCRDLPGLVDNPRSPSRTVGTRRNSATNASVQHMDMVAQKEILQTDLDLCATTPSLYEEFACKLLTRRASCFMSLIVIFLLCEIAITAAIYIYGHVHGVAWNFTTISLLVYSVVAFFGVRMMVRVIHSEELQLASGILRLYMDQTVFDQLCSLEQRKYLCAWCCFLLGLLVGQALEVWNIQRGVMDATIYHAEDLFAAKVLALAGEFTAVVAFGFSSALVLLVSYVQSVLMLGMDAALDGWCSEIFQEPEYELGVKTWNSMQAVLKCIGRDLANPTVLLQGFGSLGFVTYAISAVGVSFLQDLEPLTLVMLTLAACPAVFLFLVSIRVGAQAAALTEKCRAIPAFINQIPGDCIDHDRQYLVRFVADTSAGFIVYGITLTQSMFLKQFYALLTILAGVLGIFLRLYL